MGIGPNTVHGARVVVHIKGEDDKDYEVGIFNSVSYSIGITVVPVEVLGSLLPVELVQTGQDVVQVTCSGFRALNAGPYAQSKVPLVNDLLRYDGVTLSIFDRQKATDKASISQPLMVVKGAKCTGYRTTHNAKGVSDLEITYMGIVATDETATDQTMKDSTAVVYPLPPPA
jgi:hypothetical protein